MAWSATDSGSGIKDYTVKYSSGGSVGVGTYQANSRFVDFTAAATTQEIKTPKYYTFGGSRVAMRQGSVVYYLHGDHLGSVSLTTAQNQAVVAQSRYRPYGEERWTNGTSQTDFGFTGQCKDGFGLYDYNARYYCAYLNRFVSPDTIIPDPKNPQSLNRYSYVANNPLKFTDSTGHCFEPASATLCVAVLALTVEVVGVGIAVAAEYTGALDPVAESIANGIREGGRAAADAVQEAIIEGSTETYPLGAPPDPYSISRPTLGGEFTGPLQLPGGSTADLPDLGTGVDFPLTDSKELIPTVLPATRNVHGGDLTAEEALDRGVKWLGEGYYEKAVGVFRSADEQRQFRMTTNDLTDPRQGPHVHFESVGPDGREIQENSHVYILFR